MNAIDAGAKSERPLARALPGVHEVVLSRVAKYVPRGGAVIDMGTGQGALVAALADQGYQVTGVDIDPADFQLGKEVDHIVCDFNDVAATRDLTRCHKSSFDVAVGVEVIEHLENPWEYIRALRDLIHDEGFVIVTSPNPSSWHSRLTFLVRGEFDDFGSRGQSGHVNPIAPWEFERILTESGLEICERAIAGEVYSDRSIKHRIIKNAAKPLRLVQRGTLDGFCHVYVCRRRT